MKCGNGGGGVIMAKSWRIGGGVISSAWLAGVSLKKAKEKHSASQLENISGGGAGGGESQLADWRGWR
jgi:hypothetical protein